MGLLENLLGAAMQGMGGGQTSAGPQANPVAGALMALLTGAGQPAAGQSSAMAPGQKGPPVGGGLKDPMPGGGLGGLVSGLMGGGSPMPGGGAAPMAGAMGGGSLAAGLAALVQQFSQNGYEQQARSWIGTGANMPIEPQALNRVFGQDRLSMLAERYGIPREELLAALAEQLPQAVNELTPQGAIPEPSAMEQMLAQLMGGGRTRGF